MNDFGIAQWIVFAFAVELGVLTLKHGEFKEPDIYDFRDAIIRVMCWVITLWWGGFWG